MNTTAKNGSISAMIIEDEYLLLEDLLALVDWSALGISVVATAINGLQGLQKYDKYKPQLVITDIKMPDITGLDVMKSINYNYPEQGTVFIVISAFSDFEYAKTALRLGAKDYILKSELTADYLANILEKVTHDMTNQNEVYYKALEKNIADIINDDHLASYDTLLEVIQSAKLGESPQKFANFTAYVFEIMKNKYAKHHLEDKFHTAEIHSEEALCHYIYNALLNLEDLIQMIYHKEYSPSVLKAIDYIGMHYSNPDLMLRDIAEAVNISVSRLCVLFKKEVGKTVVDMITQKRIEEAKKLLYLDNLKVYEVADRVGYTNSQYFSKIFYQQTGQYPNECRRPVGDAEISKK